jgi:hypothetical protein
MKSPGMFKLHRSPAQAGAFGNLALRVRTAVPACAGTQ